MEIYLEYAVINIHGYGINYWSNKGNFSDKIVNKNISVFRLIGGA